MKKREAKFEILRIISILSTVMFHFFDWGGIMNETQSIGNQLLGEFIHIIGNIGVNLFVLISGYFLVTSKFKIRKLLKTIFEVWFYSVGIYIICCILKIENININTLAESFFPISYNTYWFATSYIGLYLIFPMINKVINNITREQNRYILIIMSIMLLIIPTFLIYTNPFYSNLLWFVYLYMIAAYLRKYDVKSLKDNRDNIFIIISLTLFLFMLLVIIKNIGLKGAVANNLTNQLNRKNSLPILILSIYFFAFIKNIKIKENKIITVLAQSSFAVYLIHMNLIFVKYLYYKILKIQNYYDSNTFLLLGYIVLTSIIIYIVCVFIDIIRINLIEKPIFKIKKFDKYFEKIDKIMDI